MYQAELYTASGSFYAASVTSNYSQNRTYRDSTGSVYFDPSRVSPLFSNNTNTLNPDSIKTLLMIRY